MPLRSRYGGEAAAIRTGEQWRQRQQQLALTREQGQQRLGLAREAGRRAESRAETGLGLRRAAGRRAARGLGIQERGVALREREAEGKQKLRAGFPAFVRDVIFETPEADVLARNPNLESYKRLPDGSIQMRRKGETETRTIPPNIVNGVMRQAGFDIRPPRKRTTGGGLDAWQQEEEIMGLGKYYDTEELSAGKRKAALYRLAQNREPGRYYRVGQGLGLSLTGPLRDAQMTLDAAKVTLASMRERASRSVRGEGIGRGEAREIAAAEEDVRNAQRERDTLGAELQGIAVPVAPSEAAIRGATIGARDLNQDAKVDLNEQKYNFLETWIKKGINPETGQPLTPVEKKRAQMKLKQLGAIIGI